MSPRPTTGHVRRPAILKAAAEVIAERGVIGTRIADVAERAGTSAPGVLYWFATKDELLTEALAIANVVREGQAAGEFRAVDPEGFALTLGALMDGFAIQLALHDPAVTPDTV